MKPKRGLREARSGPKSPGLLKVSTDHQASDTKQDVSALLVTKFAELLGHVTSPNATANGKSKSLNSNNSLVDPLHDSLNRTASHESEMTS